MIPFLDGLNSLRKQKGLACLESEPSDRIPSAARRYSEQSRVELAENGRSKLDLGEQGMAWIQDVVAFLGNDDAGHGEDRAAGCEDPCVSNGLG